MSISTHQRFTQQRPCPVCGGYDQAARGKGERCFGFESEDGQWAHCTREDHAGPLSLEEGSKTYAHRLTGDCRCGQSHDSSPPTPRPSANGNSARRIVAEYNYKGEYGNLLFQAIRTDPKGFYLRHPGGNGGWHLGLAGDPDKCKCPRIEPVLYGLPELIAADPSMPVFCTEGEADRNRLVEVGLVATTNPMGAGKWENRYSAWLKDRHVVVLVDNDDAGRKHASDVARSVHGVARSVRVLEFPDLPAKGDVSDWLDQGRTAEELVDLARTTKEWVPPETQGVPSGLRFRSAVEIARETPDSVPWIAEPWVAEGSITELDGKVKAGGKTTWLLALCRKVLDGQPFMKLPTMMTPVVYLTEQSMNSFREALRRADLLKREDFRVLTYHDTLGTAWPEVVEAAKQECQRIGSKLLAVDTLPQFADIPGDSENSSGAALDALGPLQVVAAGGIGVVGVRHDRKAGGDVGDSGRGSSAWGGVCDTIISIRRGDGNSSPTMRILQTLSRFDGPPDKLVIDLQDGEYVALGTETKVVEQRTREALWEVLPESGEYAKTRDELLEAADVKPTPGKKVIKEWHKAGHLSKLGKGVANNPERFWKLDIGRSEPPVVATNQQG